MDASWRPILRHLLAGFVFLFPFRDSTLSARGRFLLVVLHLCQRSLTVTLAGICHAQRARFTTGFLLVEALPGLGLKCSRRPWRGSQGRWLQHRARVQRGRRAATHERDARLAMRGGIGDRRGRMSLPLALHRSQDPPLHPVDELWDRRSRRQHVRLAPGGRRLRRSALAGRVPAHAVRGPAAHVAAGGLAPATCSSIWARAWGAACSSPATQGAQRAVGVEIDGELVAQSRANLARSQLDQQRIDFVQSGAETYSLDQATVLFMFNLFGVGVMREVIDRAHARARGPSPQPRIAYPQPAVRPVLDASPRLSGLITRRGPSGADSAVGLAARGWVTPPSARAAVGARDRVSGRPGIMSRAGLIISYGCRPSKAAPSPKRCGNQFRKRMSAPLVLGRRMRQGVRPNVTPSAERLPPDDVYCPSSKWRSRSTPVQSYRRIRRLACVTPDWRPEPCEDRNANRRDGGNAATRR